MNAIPTLPLAAESELFWTTGTFVLRLGEAVIAAVPDLLIGVLIAGLLRHLVGDDRLRWWFASWWRTTLAAIALPVGAAGVLPVAVMLRRAGVRASGVAATLLVGGAIGPLSLAYLMERATPAATGVLVAMLAATVGLAFFVVSRFERLTEPKGDDAAGLVPALAEVRPLLRASALPLLCALVAFAAMASLLPPSFLGEAMHDPSSSHAVAALATPFVAFYPPELTPLFAGEAAAGVYPGAAWTMLLGGGFSVGSVVLLVALAGRRVAGLSIVLIVMLASLGFLALHLTPRLVPLAAEDSHAFDRLSRPFHVLDDDAGVVSGIVNAWSQAVTVGTLASAAVLCLLCILPASKVRPAEGREHISSAPLYGFAPVAVAAWLVLTLYVYFPPPTVVLAQMRHAEGDLSAALGQNDVEAGLRAVEQIDRLAARGAVGGRLRLDWASADGLDDIRSAAREVAEELPAGETMHYRDARQLFEEISGKR